MNMRADLDCRATAALLDTGGSLALAGHAATLMSVLSPATATGVKLGSILVWCAMVYLTIRVKIDSRCFELLASHPAEEFDRWLQQTGLRKEDQPKRKPRTIDDRRRGALRLWRALIVAVALEMLLAMLGVARLRS